MRPEIGYEEVDHTADVALRVWAPDLLSLIEAASIGMFSLIDHQIDVGSVREASVILPAAADQECTLITILNELLFLSEDLDLHISNVQVETTGDDLRVDISGHPVLSRGSEIKAVTFSELRITRSKMGVETKLVFDV